MEAEQEQRSGKELIAHGKKRPWLESEAPQISGMTPCKDKNRDVGWEHGTSFDNNRYQWKCNWCGVMRYGGGVSMLKKHLAGFRDVKKCQNVPDEVAKSMWNHLNEKQKSREKKLGSHSTVVATEITSFNDLEADQQKKYDRETQLSDSVKTTKGEELMNGPRTQKQKTTADSSNAISQQSNELIDKCMNDGLADALFSQTKNQDVHAKSNYQQTNVLESMSRFIKINGDGSIQVCFSDALTHGPSSFAEDLKKSGPVDATQVKESQGTYSDCFQGQGQQKNLDASDNSAHCPSRLEPGSYHKKEANMSTTNSQKFFLDILCSDKFALLCDLVYESFLEGKVNSLFDLTAINAKLKNAEYDRAPASFYQDIQQVWNKFQKLGEEMVFLASSLRNMSMNLCQKLVGENLVDEANEQHEPEETCPRNATTQFRSELDLSTNQNQTVVSGFPVACICKQCETETSKEASLICGGCEAVYCFTCIKSNVENAPPQRWLCFSCTIGEKDLSEPVSDHVQPGCLHQGCIEYNRLEISSKQKDLNGYKSNPLFAMGSRNSSEAVEVSCLHESCTGCGNLEISVMQNDNGNRNNPLLATDSMVLSKPISDHTKAACLQQNRTRGNIVDASARQDDLNGNKDKLLAIDSRGNLFSSMELEAEESVLSQAAKLFICKICGVSEDGKKFLAPDQVHCPYKFYHLKCLKGQIASALQQNKRFLYCPSCLCSTCLANDDEQIILCESCEPPLSSEPQGQASCDVVKETDGMQRSEQRVVKQNTINIHSNEPISLMDLLVTAAEKFRPE